MPAFAATARPTSLTEPGSSVLVTRPEPGAGETAARLIDLGFSPIVAPLLEVRPRRVAIPPSDQVQAILVTSGSAVPGLPASHRRLPLFAVGAATARRAEAAGFAHVISANGDANALAALVERSCRRETGALLLATGQGQGDALARELRRLGFRVARRVLYRAVPVASLPEVARAAFASGTLSAVLLFSAETARVCCHLLRAAGLQGAAQTVDALAIGQPAGVALQALPWRRIRVAAQPTQEAMLALLR